MKVSITEVATTMRTLFVCGGTAPDPADMTESNNGHYNRKFACRAVCEIESSLSFMVPSRFVCFKDAFGCLNGGDNDHRHRPDQPYEEEILKDRQKMMDQEIHNNSLYAQTRGESKKPC